MGAIVMLKHIDLDGEENHVNLSGIEKARVYEMLAKFGVYETEPNGQLPNADKSDNLFLSTKNSNKAEMVEASTMHCCEAAEIIFEDIT